MHLAFLGALLVAQIDPVFDLPALLKPPLETKVLKTAEAGGIVTEEVRFFSHADGAKRIEIFGFFSYPKGAKKLPAFVWNQGGLAQASTYWTEFGAKRGYAALCIDFPIPGYRSTGGYPINSNVELGDDPRQAPIYHGAAALLRAVSFLESRPEVDPQKLGMAGSSWGGFYATLQAGLDPRLKAVSSMFGSGALPLGNAWWDGQGPNPSKGDAFRRRWSETLDPALRLPHSNAAIAWFTGTNDSFYWLPAVAESHRRTKGAKHLALLANWNHALDEAMDEQVFRWLDVHLKGAEPFLAVSPLKVDDRNVRWTHTGKRKGTRGELLVSFGSDAWVSRCWIALAATRDGNAWTAALPPTKASAIVYGSVVDDEGNRSCTPIAVLAGDPQAAKATLPFDGCSMWCGERGFTKTWHERHGYPLPPLELQGGKLVVRPKGGTNLGPVHFAPGIAHRLTIEGKLAGTQAELTGSFDGMKVGKKAAAVGNRIEFDFRPPQARSARLDLILHGAADGSTVVEKVRFEPAE